LTNASIWTRWLMIASLLVIAFGLCLAFFPSMPPLEPVNRQVEAVFALEQAAPGPRAFQRWIYGAWGATIAGWGLLVFSVVRSPLRKGERWAWDALAGSLLLWYVVDSGLSFAFQITANVVLNTVFLVALGLPLLFTRSARGPTNSL
jgi:hypothetical protein